MGVVDDLVNPPQYLRLDMNVAYMVIGIPWDDF